MTRHLFRLGLALVALGTAMLAQPVPAGAATVTKVGWWYRTSDPRSTVPREASSPLVPDVAAGTIAPPVPQSHLHVEGTPEGATAIAALTYALHERESSPVLTIDPDDDSITPTDLVILACRAAVDWAAPPTNPGRWQDKPLVDCGRSVNGIVNEDGDITFALQLLVSGPDLNVVLVPGVVEGTPGRRIGSTFSLSFNVTEGTKLTTTAAPVGETSSRSSRSTDEPPYRSLSPAPPQFVAPSAVVAEPALEPQEQAPTVPAVPEPAVASAVAESTTGRGVGIAVLLIGAAVAALAHVKANRAARTTIGLGRFRRAVGTAGNERGDQKPVTGGLGRFARPRTGAPASLS